MTVSISVTDICESIYAESALRHYLQHKSSAPRPALLHSDHLKMLEPVVRDAFFDAVVRLKYLAQYMNYSDDSDVMSVDLRCPDDIPADILAYFFRDMVLHIVFARVWTPVDAAYGSEHDKQASTIALALQAFVEFNTRPPKLRIERDF